MFDTDILIIGAGPAGLALGAAVSASPGNVRCAIVSPMWPAPWPNTFGLWEDELAHDQELVARCSHRFTRPTVHLGARQLELERTYLRLENDAVRDLLMQRFVRGGGEQVEGLVEELRHEAMGSVAVVRDGLGACHSIHTKVVVDATGNAPRFVRRVTPDDPGYQVAYGVHAQVVSAPEGWLDTMRVMDFRPAGANREAESKKPSFLYAMPLSESEVFLEETSLVERPGMSIEELRARLDARLAREGVVLAGRHDEEFCRIPMGHALPDFEQRTLAWGGAASGVHPASGYQVARTFRRSPALAGALVELCETPGLSGAQRAKRAWQAIWPARDVKRRELYMYGLELLIAMDLAEIERFFTAFFELPDPLWQGYMSDTLDHSQVITSMWHMFSSIRGFRRFELMRPMWQSKAMRARLVEGVLGGAIEALR